VQRVENITRDRLRGLDCRGRDTGVRLALGGVIDNFLDAGSAPLGIGGHDDSHPIRRFQIFLLESLVRAQCQPCIAKTIHRFPRARAGYRIEIRCGDSVRCAAREDQQDN